MTVNHQVGKLTSKKFSNSCFALLSFDVGESFPATEDNSRQAINIYRTSKEIDPNCLFAFLSSMSGVESQLQTGDKLFTLHQREIRPSFLFASALLCQVDKQFKLNHFLINIHRYNFLYFNTIDLLLLKKNGFCYAKRCRI